MRLEGLLLTFQHHAPHTAPEIQGGVVLPQEGPHQIVGFIIACLVTGRRQGGPFAGLRRSPARGAGFPKSL